MVEILAAATAAHEIVTSKPTNSDIDKFDERANYMLVEILREYDTFGMLCLSKDPYEYGTITEGSTITKIGKMVECYNSIAENATESVRKRAEVQRKVKLNCSKVEATVERGAKNMPLAAFGDTHAKKLKRPIKLCAGVKCLKLTQHLRKYYHKLH